MKIKRLIILVFVFVMSFNFVVFSAGNDEGNIGNYDYYDYYDAVVNKILENSKPYEGQNRYADFIQNYVTDVKQINKGLRVFRQINQENLGFTVTVNKAINAIKYRSNIDYMFVHKEKVAPHEDLLELSKLNRVSRAVVLETNEKVNLENSSNSVLVDKTFYLSSYDLNKYLEKMGYISEYGELKGINESDDI